MELFPESLPLAAFRIDDPVARLRFLQAAVPVPRRRRRWTARFALILPLVLTALFTPSASAPVPVPNPQVPPAEMPFAAPDVWMVEKAGDSETYSNGLRIDNRFLVTTHPRSWLAFPADGGEPERGTEPAGIVFHTTESQQVPFAATENQVLQRIGESLLEYVRRLRAYNFVIDRFGRVYRVVAENEVANHAGNSVWADDKLFYVNLNESFLGLSFEAASETAEISPAQVRSAAMLIEMLRHRFSIPASNFVAHAQVSVNPSNMRAGSHVDWASGFPFEAVGLADNYPTPLPAVWAYGFDCDAHFTSRMAAPMRAGIEAAEAILNRQAVAAGLGPVEYKRKLRLRYRAMLAQARRKPE